MKQQYLVIIYATGLIGRWNSTATVYDIKETFGPFDHILDAEEFGEEKARNYGEGTTTEKISGKAMSYYYETLPLSVPNA